MIEPQTTNSTSDDSLELNFGDAIPKQEISMFRRMFLRSLVLGLLTFVGAIGLELLTQMGRFGFDINERFPQLIIFLSAAVILTWAEVSVLWIRAATAPKLDFQVIAEKAAESSIGAAVVYAGMIIQWLFRIWLIVLIAGFVK